MMGSKKHRHSTSEIVDQEHEGEDIYVALGITRNATQEEVKKAYRRLALTHHPDKIPVDSTQQERAEATKRFQQLSLYYAILSDETKRRRYDRTGSVEDASSSILDNLNHNDMDWDTYFRELYGGIVNVEKIEKFALKYKGSKEEREDVIQAYKDSDGDMNRIMEAVPYAEDAQDEERIRKIIDNLIKENKLESTSLYKSSTTKTQKKKREKANKAERQEAERMAKEKGLGEDLSDLQALVRKRNANFGGIMDNLLAKYGDPKEKKKNKNFVEPSEEEFAAIQAELMNKKRKR